MILNEKVIVKNIMGEVYFLQDRMLETIGQWLLQLVDQLGYGGLAFAMLIESVFPPIPSELIMPFGGFLASQGKMTLWGVILSGTIGAYLGVLPFYIIGYIGHKTKLLELTKKYGKYIFIREEEVESGFSFFKKRGYGFIFFGRFIPLVRSVVSFPAGALRMNFWLYSLYTLLGSAVWCTILAGFGFVLGENWSQVSLWMAKYEKFLIPLIAIAFFVYVGYLINNFIKHKRQKTK